VTFALSCGFDEIFCAIGDSVCVTPEVDAVFFDVFDVVVVEAVVLEVLVVFCDEVVFDALVFDVFDCVGFDIVGFDVDIVVVVVLVGAVDFDVIDFVVGVVVLVVLAGAAGCEPCVAGAVTCGAGTGWPCGPPAVTVVNVR
jgi:hypothetical protein